MPPPSTPDLEYEQPFNEAFDQIRTGIQTATDKFDEVVDNVNQWIWMYGLATLWYVKNKLDDVRDGLEQVIEKVNYALEHQLPVLSLISTSFRWVYDVKTPISELSFRTTEPDNENLYEWTGAAATAYNAKAGKQKAAVDEAVLKAEFISQWLFKIARANVDYAVALAKIVTEFVGNLLQAAAETGSVIDIPFAVSTLADSVGKLVTAGLNTLLDIGQRFLDALGNVRDLATQIGDHSKLPGGRWPEAVRG